jgi:Protein of unknown function (DUF2679).
MRRWTAFTTAGRWIGLALLILILIAAALIGTELVQFVLQPPQLWQVDLALYGRVLLFLVLLALASVVGYRVLGAFTLAYLMDRNGLYISWLGNRSVVPLSQIDRIDVGEANTKLALRPLQAIGYYRAESKTSDGRPLHIFSTLPPEKSLVIHTKNEAFAISPADQDAFVQDLEQRRNIGAVKALTSELQAGRIFLYDFWRDRVVRNAVLIAIVLNLLLGAFVAASYPDLEPMIEMRFNAAGEAAGAQPRHQVLFLPLAAFGLLLFNIALGLSIYLRQKDGARLLQLTSILVQVLFGIAVITIITR